MTTTALAGSATSDGQRPLMLRRIVAGAAPFDGLMGIVCLAAGRPLGDALGIGTAAVEGTGAVFLLAAAAGAWTVRRGCGDVRLLVAANALFAVWCLGAVAFDSPNQVGATVLVVSAVASAATAVTEARLGR